MIKLYTHQQEVLKRTEGLNKVALPAQLGYTEKMLEDWKERYMVYGRN